MPDQYAMFGILEFVFGPFRDRLYQSYFDKRAKRRQQQTQLCTAAISRIQRERPNFQHIVAGTGYRNDAHRRAVTESSFELVRVDVLPLQNMRRFRKPTKALLANVQIKNAAAVLTAIDALEPKLAKFIGD